MRSKFFKITVIILIIATLFTLTACSKKPINELRKKENKNEISYPAATLNAENVYSSMTYTPEMFMGNYYLAGGTKTEKDYFENSDTWTTAYGSYNDQPQEITLIPFMMRTGEYNFYHRINAHKEHVFGEFYFKNINGNLLSITCAVEVKDNETLCLIPVESFEYNEETGESSYTLSSDTVMEYGFEFKGFDLTLSANGKSVELTATSLTDYYKDYGSDKQICSDAYLKAGSKKIDNILGIDFLSNDKKPKYDRFYLKVENEDGDRNTYQAEGILGEDGLFTFSYTDDNGSIHAYQYVYFYLDNDGIALSDGENNYYYTNPYYSDLDAIIAEEDKEAAQNLTADAVEELIKKKTSLFDALAKAFEEAGISASVDSISGEIAIDSAVLFETNKADISEEGQQFLTNFWGVYTSVINSDEYEGFINSIAVEGHADPTGNYDDNMVLSENRAKSVLEFCDSIGSSDTPLEAKGFSSDKPILNEDGSVNNDASRRVAFRFRVNI